jgi:hypothetical protein
MEIFYILEKGEYTIPLENRFEKDITDQSQASSSRSGNPERLQQLRRAHGAQPEQKSNGKGIMTAEMQNLDTQEKQQKWDNNHIKAIKEVTKQRDGKTSYGSKISLGYQEGLKGGAYPITENDLYRARQDVAHQHGSTTNNFHQAVDGLIRLLGSRRTNVNGVENTLKAWKETNDEWTNERTRYLKQKFAEIMLDN